MINVVVAMISLLFLACLLLPSCGSARETGRQNTCRNNLSRLAMAAVQYDARHGRLPGYMNARDRHGEPKTGTASAGGDGPVSWVVELLPDLHQLRASEGRLIAPASSAATLTNTAQKSSAPTDHTSTHTGRQHDASTSFLDFLICPSDEKRGRNGPMLCYVANTGMPDLPQAIPPRDGAPGMPRDWPANGVFLDKFSEMMRVRGGGRPLGPTLTMRIAAIHDPKDKTILFSENVDAKSYLFAGGDAALTETAWGIVWAPGPILWSSKTSAPNMPPSDVVLPPNAELEHSQGAPSYKYCRPSSRHPGGFNLALAGKNVVLLRETISYAIYAKLMASDDANMKLPGSEALIDERFRAYQMRDEDLNP